MTGRVSFVSQHSPALHHQPLRAKKGGSTSLLESWLLIMLFPMNKRFSTAVILLAWAVSFVPSAWADPIQLRPAQTLQLNGSPLGYGTTFAVPCVADWNRDGRKDLLVGYQLAGKIALYLNSGSDAQPVFTSVSNLQYHDPANGWTDIVHVSPGNCGAPAPWVCDFDADGKPDLLVGDGANGCVYFYRNTNPDANAAPLLAPGVRLKVGTNDLTVGFRATPYVCDWDGDGLQDLLCGDFNGYVWFFKNTNTAQVPVFAPGVKIQAGGADLCLAGSLGGVGRSVVRAFDWDGDGLRDLVCSSDGGVYWCRNTNSNSNPILQAPVTMCIPATNSLVPILTRPVSGARMRIDLADWNDDGVMDLLLGDYSGKVYYFEGYRFAVTSATTQPGGQLVLQWDSATNLNYNILLGNLCPTNADWGLAVTNLPSQGNTTAWTNQMQGGQQFFRIQIAK